MDIKGNFSSDFLIGHHHPDDELVPMKEISIEHGAFDDVPENSIWTRHVYECPRCDPPQRVTINLYLKADIVMPEALTVVVNGEEVVVPLVGETREKPRAE